MIPASLLFTLMRATAYVSKPSAIWLGHVELLSQKHFYLMGKLGPTVFQIKDEEDRIHKVTLGNPSKCTCLAREESGTGDSCIHIVYCVLKILKVAVTHPLAHQSSLTDSELDQILSGACTERSRRKNSSIVRRGGVRQVRETEDNSQSTMSAMERAKEEDKLIPGLATRHALSEDEDNSCPICQDAMVPAEMHTLTWCRTGCGNNLHTHCMMKFSQHRQSNHKDTTCPLCRHPWDLDLLRKDLALCQMESERLKKDSRRKKSNSKRYQILPVHCSQCSCLLRNTFYRCLDCSHLNLCSASVGGSTMKALCDLCEGCLTRGAIGERGGTHSFHRFLENDASNEEPQIAWKRGLNVHNVLSSLVDSLPPLSLLQMNRNPRGSSRTSAIAVVCWICQSNAMNGASAALLACKHGVHRECLLQELQPLLQDALDRYRSNNTSVTIQDLQDECTARIAGRFRCGASGCGRTVFPALRRVLERNRDNVQSKASSENVDPLLPLLAQGTSLLQGGLGMISDTNEISNGNTTATTAPSQFPRGARPPRAPTTSTHHDTALEGSSLSLRAHAIHASVGDPIAIRDEMSFMPVGTNSGAIIGAQNVMLPPKRQRNIVVGIGHLTKGSSNIPAESRLKEYGSRNGSLNFSAIRSAGQLLTLQPLLSGAASSLQPVDTVDTVYAHHRSSSNAVQRDRDTLSRRTTEVLRRIPSVSRVRAAPDDVLNPAVADLGVVARGLQNQTEGSVMERTRSEQASARTPSVAGRLVRGHVRPVPKSQEVLYRTSSAPNGERDGSSRTFDVEDMASLSLLVRHYDS